VKRSSSLKRTRGRLKPSRRKKPQMSLDTRVIAWARTAGRCACGCERRAVEPHHILPRQKWPALVDSPENVVYLAATCHARHESGYKRLARAAVSPVGALPLTAQQESYLERTYV
jgi:hypothetical protein